MDFTIVADANDLADQITTRLASINHRRRRRRFVVSLLCLLGLILSLIVVAGLVWIVTE